MSQTSHDAKAVVRALADLTTQVRRLADARQSDFALTPDAADEPTTTAVCNEPGPWGDAHACIRPAGHDDDHAAHDGCGWRGGETNEAPAAAEDGAQYRLDQERNAAALHRQGLISDSELNAVFAATDEYALRATRRESARIILDRATRGIALRSDESALLRQHFEAEIREHDTARSVAAGNKRHVQMMYAELEQAQADAEQHARNTETVARERESYRKAWKDEQQRRAEAQAAIERVRAARDRMAHAKASDVDAIWCLDLVEAALKGTEQPTTEA